MNSKSVFRLLGIFMAALSAVGCATITRGTTEVLVINSDPIGADVSISDGYQCRTPCSVELQRKHDYHITLVKAGYEPVDTDVRSQIVGAGAAGMAGNVLIGGIIGAGVDAASGATKGFKPNPLDVKLVALVGPAHSVDHGQPTDSSIASGSSDKVSVEPACDQPTDPERTLCRGLVFVGMTRDDVIGILGPPDGRSDDPLTLRFGQYLLQFDTAGALIGITPPAQK